MMLGRRGSLQSFLLPSPPKSAFHISLHKEHHWFISLQNVLMFPDYRNTLRALLHHLGLLCKVRQSDSSEQHWLIECKLCMWFQIVKLPHPKSKSKKKQVNLLLIIYLCNPMWQTIFIWTCNRIVYFTLCSKSSKPSVLHSQSIQFGQATFQELSIYPLWLVASKLDISVGT